MHLLLFYFPHPHNHQGKTPKTPTNPYTQLTTLTILFDPMFENCDLWLTEPQLKEKLKKSKQVNDVPILLFRELLNRLIAYADPAISHPEAEHLVLYALCWRMLHVQTNRANAITEQEQNLDFLD